MSSSPIATAVKSLYRSAVSGNSVKSAQFSPLAMDLLKCNDTEFNELVGQLLRAGAEGGAVGNMSTEGVDEILARGLLMSDKMKLSASSAAQMVLVQSLRGNMRPSDMDRFMGTISSNEANMSRDDQLTMLLAKSQWKLNENALTSFTRSNLQSMVFSSQVSYPMKTVVVDEKESYMGKNFTSLLEQNVAFYLNDLHQIVDSQPANDFIFPLPMRCRSQRKLFLCETTDNFYLDAPTVRRASYVWQLRYFKSKGWKLHTMFPVNQWGLISEGPDDLSSGLARVRREFVVQGLDQELKM